MGLSSRQWILLWALCVVGTSAAHSLLPVRVLTRDDLAADIDTAGDPELEEWLASLQRAPSLSLCPSSCSENATSEGGWALYSDPGSLATCNETMILDVAVQNDVQDGQDTLAIRACAADYTSDRVVFEADEETASLCTTPNHILLEAPVMLSSHPDAGSDETFSIQHLLAAGRQMSNYLGSNKPSCTNNVLSFAYSQSSILGLFGGAEVHQHGITTEVLNKFLAYAEQRSISKPTIVQLCEGDGRGADYGVGVAAGSIKNFALVQQAVRTWADGRCVPETDGEADSDWITVTLRVPKAEPKSSNSTDIVTSEDATSPAYVWSRSSRHADLVPRAECRSIKVKSGDGCWALADRCKITEANLKKFNPRTNFCTTLVIGEPVCCTTGTLPETIPPGNSDGSCKTRSVIGGDSCASLASKCGLSANDFMKVNTKQNLCSSLAVGQPVCCTRGKMPDLRPKPKPNGYCFDYTIKQDDDCSIIAAKNGLTVANLESFNKNTWGWNGCKPLFPNTKMCLSTGNTPMPAQVANAICGPTVKGTVQPPAGTNISTLNPCPLNVCCNIWGNCGLTDDFCTISRAASGAPGTSAPGKNGCIHNCGKSIKKGSAPAKKINVAYFEAWNHNRDCLHMDVTQIDKTRYSHIHFAFIDVTRDFKMNITSVKQQFDKFKTMTGIKKIASFGGWDFSVMPETFQILRDAVKPANRATFVKNLISFMNEHKLDGIDLDWEYPGAPDMPDIPAGSPDEGSNYYQTLLSLKQQVGSGKTVSFAAPASYHYLKSFPMKKMGESLDYIIYMTYDLHGQWDYNNKWTTPGCPSGNCLRSHVNETETNDALAMITKAGVPSNKVVVGVSSYGRSFKMAQAGCDGPNCKFTGTSKISNAKKGRCTNTAGYISNAEISEIIKKGKVTKQWKTAGSNMLVYDSTEWVAYMDEAMKKTRSAFYDSYNFAGTTDWAVDLQEFWDNSNFTENWAEADIKNIYPDCGGKYTTFKQLEDRADSMPKHCVNKYILDVEIAVMENALKKYKSLVDNGYDKKFDIYSGYISGQVPDQIDAFMATEADSYFQCKETGKQQCCADCTYATCIIDCNKSEDCKKGIGTYDIDCPTTLKDGNVPTLSERIRNATYMLEDSDKFYKDIFKTYGIEKSWIKYGRKHVRTNNGCQYAEEDIMECIDKYNNWWYDYPLKDKVEVFDPKDLIGEGYDESMDLLSRFKIKRASAAYDPFLLWIDLADAASLPSLTMEEAVASMDKIVEKANEIKKKQREQFILDFISGLLFFIPIIGSAAGIAGMSTVRGLLSLIGVVGEAGLLVYGIVEDPDSAFMTIFGALAGAGIGRSGFRNAADSRRSMSSGELEKLGTIKNKLDLIETIRGGSCSI